MNCEEFLTEDKIGDFLKSRHPSKDWIPQYGIGQRFRVDWFSSNVKTAVEFDGYQHYTSSRQIFNDKRKDKLCAELGLTIVRIPYFVQLCPEVIRLLFGFDCEFEQKYPHGFVSKKSTMVFPADFCELGVLRFKDDLKRFSCISDEITGSLKDAIREHPAETVLPLSLMGMVS